MVDEQAAHRVLRDVGINIRIMYGNKLKAKNLHAKVRPISENEVKKCPQAPLTSDPVHDQAFIALLTQVYDPGVPKIYPAEAPGPDRLSAA